MKYDELVGRKKKATAENTTEQKKDTGEVDRLPPPFLQRLKKTLLPNDPKTVMINYFWERWLPGVRDSVCDMLIDAVDGFFSNVTDGKVSSTRRRNRYHSSSLYDSRIGRKEAGYEGGMTWREWDHIAPLQHKFDAEDILIGIREHVDQYHKLSMREWFEFQKVKADFTNCDYGFVDVDPEDFIITEYGGGYKIDALVKPSRIR